MGIKELEDYIMNRKDRPNMPLIWPCCKEKLPAPLDGVALATCGKCDCAFTPEVIFEFNVLLEIADDSEAQLKKATETLQAVKDTLEAADCNGVVLWIRPPYQAEGVHESAIERIGATLAAQEGRE